MNVYVESNFVLEVALEQEQCESCEQLIKLASAGSIRLAIPAFSLAEPHIALLRRANDRSRLGAELQRQLSELGRSRPYRESRSAFSEFAAVLSSSAERERAGLERTVESLLNVAEVIPLDPDVFHISGTFQWGFGMPIQDALVLASIQLHLSKMEPPESCFLNRNTKDFDNPSVRELLESFRCQFFGRFDDGLRYVEGRL